MAEILSGFSCDLMKKHVSLSSLSLELAKSRDQVHEDRRSVGFTFWAGRGRGAQLPWPFRRQPASSLALAMMLGHEITWGPGNKPDPPLGLAGGRKDLGV